MGLSRTHQSNQKQSLHRNPHHYHLALTERNAKKLVNCICLSHCNLQQILYWVLKGVSKVSNIQIKTIELLFPPVTWPQAAYDEAW